MWLKFLNSKWFERLFTAAIAIIGILLTQRVIAGREDSTTIKREFDKRPTYEYVDNQDNRILNYVEKQDNNTTELIKAHIDESSKREETLMNYIISMDGKINILLGKTK